ncbi:MAG: hypothetical protein J6575_03565 [Bifidobacterium sp.]|nr:hypothetical protein [Bifidobacterium sp.]
MATLTLNVPMNDTDYMRADLAARDNGTTLANQVNEYVSKLVEAAEDKEDLDALDDALAHDDGTRLTNEEMGRELGL